MTTLTERERLEIATILSRRANEIAGYKSDHKDMPASVDYGLTLEIQRLRELSQRVSIGLAGTLDLQS